MVTLGRTCSPSGCSHFFPQPIAIGGACAVAGVGPCAAWISRQSLHGRTCGVSHAGMRASTLGRPRHSRRTGKCRAQD
ncbi:hypothetical protein FPL04_06435 [Xanthomonas arboricola]|nr:hypothetical protein FPL04_06435 [Xanthomonas arboricola]